MAKVKLSPEELRAVKRFNGGSGCEYPDMECEYCDAFIRAMRDPSLRDKTNLDMDFVYKRGAAVARGLARRKRKA